jgi:exopolyphosphatase / guanosine-5'-triphosphate,3'-diphosphate pyrophosphatase
MVAEPAHAARQLAVLPGGTGPERRAAVIDMGSNSWRLVLYAYRPGSSWRRVGELSEPVRIASGLSRTGELAPAAIERGLETLDVFARYCAARRVPVADVDVVATSAIRDAANRDALLGPARARTGFAIEVLTSEQEARMGYLAAVNSSTLADGAVLDLGGGSLQLTAVRERRVLAAGSWPLGAVRVTERLLPGPDPVSRGQLKRVRRAIREEIDGAGWLASTGLRIVGMGGAVRNLAAAAHRAGGGEPASVQGLTLGRKPLAALVRALAARPAAQRALPGIKSSRADIVLGAALVLETVLDAGGFAELEVTRAGMREGLFFSRRLLAGAEPLLDDVRGAAVRNLALQCGGDPAHTEHVARLATGLYDSLAAARVIEADAGERELLHSAALLHDAGMTVGYEGHTGHARYVILNAGLAAHTPRDVALLALTVRHLRKGIPDPAELGPLARKGDDELLGRCTLLLRLAEQLEHGEDQSVRAAGFVARPRGLELRLEGDGRLARWGIERRVGADAFARAFGRRLVLAT